MDKYPDYEELLSRSLREQIAEYSLRAELGDIDDNTDDVPDWYKAFA